MTDKQIKEIILVIIVILAFLFWSLIYFFIYDLENFGWDFRVFYLAGRNIIFNPNKLYIQHQIPLEGVPFDEVTKYLYLPNISYLFIPFIFFSYNISLTIFTIILFLFGIAYILLFRKILKLLNIEKPLHIFIILMIISNGYSIIMLTAVLQPKYIVLCIILFFIKRELEVRKGIRLVDAKFLFIQASLLVLFVGFMPYFIFIVPIYALHCIHFKDWLKTESLKKYSMIIVSFVFQNLIFLFYPSIIQHLFSEAAFKGIDMYSAPENPTWDNLTEIKISTPLNTLKQIGYLFSVNLVIISLILLCTLTIILCLRSNMNIEKKLGFFMLGSLFINYWVFLNQILVLVVMIAILLLPYVERFENKKDTGFFPKILILLCISCLFIIMFMPEIKNLYDLIPSIIIIPVEIMILRWTIIYIVFLISLILLHFQLIQSDSIKKNILNEHL
jgi:hypothetical protein